MEQARKRSSEIKIGVLAERKYKRALKFSEKINAYSFHSYIKNVKPKHIEKAKALGLKNYVFTVNKDQQFEKLKIWKVDGVFTDFPNVIDHSHESWNQS